MKKLIGLVLAKESNTGVPNLVVVAYDSASGSLIERDQQSMQSFGRRIASVLTDQSGAFSFTGEELVFNGNEARPNLVLVVFAPEDVQSVERPYPLPPEQRILYVSPVPRTDAGAEEAFIIRLLQDQLDKYSIPGSSTSGKSQDAVNRMQQALSDSLGLRDGLKKQLGPRLRREQQRVDRIRKIAAAKVKHLSGIPVHLRSGDLRDTRFLIHGRRELATKLKPAQDAVIADGLKRLKQHKPKLRLTLNLADLKNIGLTYEKGKLTGKADPKKLAETTRSLIKGFDLVRRDVPSSVSIGELRRKYLAHSEKPPATASARSSKTPKRSGGKRG